MSDSVLFLEEKKENEKLQERNVREKDRKTYWQDDAILATSLQNPGCI